MAASERTNIQNHQKKNNTSTHYQNHGNDNENGSLLIFC